MFIRSNIQTDAIYIYLPKPRKSPIFKNTLTDYIKRKKELIPKEKHTRKKNEGDIVLYFQPFSLHHILREGVNQLIALCYFPQRSNQHVPRVFHRLTSV